MTAANEIKKLREELQELRREMAVTRRERINARPRQPEQLDPTPMAVPIENQGPPSMRALVQEYVRGEISKQAAESDLGTFEEEDDFEEENPDLLDLSGYEVTDYLMEDEIPVEDPSPAGSSDEPVEGSSEPPEAPLETEAPPPQPTP